MKMKKNTEAWNSGLPGLCRGAGGLLSALLLVVAASVWPGAEAAAGGGDVQTGFLVVAGDRGFIGNEEIIDEFQLFAEGRNASLVFVTDERTAKYLKSGVDRLLKQGARRVVMMPLFMSPAEPRYQLARRLLEHERIAVPVSHARLYGQSLPAVEDLADRLRTVSDPRTARLIVAGYGASDADTEQRMRADWNRIVHQASAGFGFSSADVVIAPEKPDDEAEMEAAADRLKQELARVVEGHGESRTVMVPFHLGPKLDCMMSLDAKLQQMLPAGIRFVAGDGLDACANSAAQTHHLALWMQREANRSQPLAREDVGVVILAHGSDFHWNETMREAVDPLMKDYKIEFAFSMADQPIIARALRRLEQRGAKAAVIVRVFGMEESFRRSIEHMTGADIENKPLVPVNAESYLRGHGAHGSTGGYSHGHGGHGGHGHGSQGGQSPAPRILTALPVRSVGGIGASPLFAEALLDRANALSRDPSRETVILVAHGSGDDVQNERWQGLLETMAEHMRKAGGDRFRAIRTATWREDWPEKRAPWVEKMRAMVAEANREGGRAIVIPARTTGEGPEKAYLSGLEFELGSGFAPHPKFVQWVKEMIGTGIAQLDRDRSAPAAIVSDNR